MTGKIARIVADKGFGFIRDEESGKDFFFHKSSLSRQVTFEMLREGQAVEFEEEQSNRGPRATMVVLHD